MPGTWRTAAAGLDGLTAACAAFNLAYFLYRLVATRREETASRVVAVLALALVSLGAMGESLFFLASLTVLPGSPPATLPWALVRALPLAGAGLVSVLILRRLLAFEWPACR